MRARDRCYEKELDGFFFSSRRRHTRSLCDWSSDVCSSDLPVEEPQVVAGRVRAEVGELGPAALALRESVAAQPPGPHPPRHEFERLQLPEDRSEERRVGKEYRIRAWPYHIKIYNAYNLNTK